MNGCVYRTSDDKCEFYSDYGKGIVSYCDFADCEDKKPSNADRIRSMTDEELANWISGRKETCPPIKDYKCSAMSCYECWLAWMRKEAESEGEK